MHVHHVYASVTCNSNDDKQTNTREWGIMSSTIRFNKTKQYKQSRNNKQRGLKSWNQTNSQLPIAKETNIYSNCSIRKTHRAIFGKEAQFQQKLKNHHAGEEPGAE